MVVAGCSHRPDLPVPPLGQRESAGVRDIVVATNGYANIGGVTGYATEPAAVGSAGWIRGSLPRPLRAVPHLGKRAGIRRAMDLVVTDGHANARRSAR